MMDKKPIEKSVKSGWVAWRSLSYQDEKYFGEVRRDLIAEYQVKSTSELLLIDATLVAYLRYLRINKLLNTFLDGINDYQDTNQESMNMVKQLNRALDSANQQMITSLTCLNELKRQPIKVKVKVLTQKAYFAQNQQINENRP